MTKWHYGSIALPGEAQDSFRDDVPQDLRCPPFDAVGPRTQKVFHPDIHVAVMRSATRKQFCVRPENIHWELEQVLVRRRPDEFEYRTDRSGLVGSFHLRAHAQVVQPL